MASKLTLCSLLFAATAVSAAAGPRSSGEKLISSFLSDPSSALVNGFARAIKGETIDYHSVNELARLALLTRTTDGTMAIEWRTAPLPVNGKEFTTFFWLSALAGSKGVHSFEVTLNGRQWFSFSSPADTSQDSWTIQHPSGGSLAFAALESDRYGDLFGYTFLRLPSSSFRAGDSLTIRIAGEAAGSTCWYMVFEHPMVEEAEAESLPALVRDQGSTCQVVRVTIEHYGGPKEVAAFINPTRSVRQRIGWGASTLIVPTDSVKKEERRTLTIETEGEPSRQIPVTLRPVRTWELYLLPHSHTDIGYSDHQLVVEKNHMRYLDEAIAIARRTSTYPAGARFRWNVEVLWPLQSYMDRSTEEQRQRVIEAIRKGWIGINGLYANELTGLCRPEELFHLTEYARRLSATYGITVNAAMITDIPSYTSNIVTALSESGIRYFSSGPNFSPGMPDGGDRVGHALKEWGDRPFYWESQSGQSRVLFWMTGTGYSWFHGWIMGRLSRTNTTPILRYLEHLEDSRYPYDIVQLRYTIDGDNGPPDPDLPDFVRQWNGRYVSPKFRIATTSELFEEFERRYGTSLPVLRGDLTPVWEDGAVSSAAEVALNRSAAETLVQSEVLSSMFGPRDFPASDFASAWRDVVLFDEHTWGAWNSVSEPDSPSVISQWEYKRNLVRSASQEAEGLRGRLLGGPGATDEVTGTLDVVNTCSWKRSDIVVIPRTVKLVGSRVKDESGTGMPSQVLASGDLAVLAGDVPPLGSKRLIFERGAPHLPSHPVSVSGNLLASDRLRVEVDPVSGSIGHLVEHSGSPQGIEFVDRNRGSGLDEYIYVPGRDPAQAQRESRVTISAGEQGPLIASLIVESTPPGCKTQRREYSMVAGLQRVDVVNTIDKLRVRDKESVHYGFPFLVEQGVTRADEGLEVIRPETDQLPGANKDYFSVQRWVDVSNSARGVTWATVDAPLVEIGQLTSEKPGPAGYRIWRDTILPAQNFYSYAMNNYWHTNYKADQEGAARFRYSIQVHAAYSREQATTFGIERSQPLLLMLHPVARRRRTPLFTLSPPGVIATSVVPSTDGRGWCVHLFNAGDSPAEVRMHWRRDEPVSLFVSNLFQERKGEFRGPMKLPSSGVLMLKVERR